MSDPRLVAPQRVEPSSGSDGDVCAHRYWCRTRIAAVVLAALAVAGLAAGLWWWIR